MSQVSVSVTLRTEPSSDPGTGVETVPHSHFPICFPSVSRLEQTHDDNSNLSLRWSFGPPKIKQTTDSRAAGEVGGSGAKRNLGNEV